MTPTIVRLAASAACMALATLSPNAARAAVPGHAIVQLPVSFQVTNADNSAAACPADNKRYEMRGHLVASRDALSPGRPRAVTLYIHGALVSGEGVWRFDAVAGYDYARELAELGHASVVIDRLGYGTSGKPLGNLTCFGADADVAHQVITALRTGNYLAAGTAGPAFARVALAGHSVGGAIAQVEAYSFGAIDGLLIFEWAEPENFTSIAATTIATDVAQSGCPVGERKHGDSGPLGYFFFKAFTAPSLHLAHPDPAVAAAFTRALERDPCGLMLSPAVLAANRSGLASVNVPVLLVYAAESALLTPGTGDRQAALFKGSPDVTVATTPRSGHLLMLDGSAGAFRRTVAEWLGRHGL